MSDAHALIDALGLPPYPERGWYGDLARGGVGRDAGYLPLNCTRSQRLP
jgi:hypothetical protein